MVFSSLRIRFVTIIDRPRLPGFAALDAALPTQQNPPMNPVDPSRWLLLLNPVSGRGQGLRDRDRILAASRAAGLACDVAVSAHAGHCIQLVSEGIAAGYRRFLVGGGDGSLSEAVNGIMAQTHVPPTEITLALLPIGTGNDWARGQGISRDYAMALAVAAAGHVRRFDVGVIDFEGGGRRWFINVAGIGFDAGVVENMPSRSLGRLAYLIGLVRELMAYRPLALRFHPGGTAVEARAMLLFACLGRYCGGGMLVAPEARADDGALDLVLIRHMPLHRVLRALPRLFDGRIGDHPEVGTWRCPSLAIEAPVGAAMEADGELVGHAPARISVLPRAVGIVVPA
jgi:YegS/Rv2252/BmrU family lipid kinase